MWVLVLSIGCLMLGATLGIFFHCMIIVAKQSEGECKDNQIIKEKTN